LHKPSIQTTELDNRAKTGDELRDFVNRNPFLFLHAEIKNKISSGYNLREIIDHIDEFPFRPQDREARAVASLRSQDPRYGQRWRGEGGFGPNSDRSRRHQELIETREDTGSGYQEFLAAQRRWQPWVAG
jgi:hypothetical protein